MNKFFGSKLFQDVFRRLFIAIGLPCTNVHTQEDNYAFRGRFIATLQDSTRTIFFNLHQVSDCSDLNGFKFTPLNINQLNCLQSERISSISTQQGVVSIQEAKRYIIDCLKAVQAPEPNAEQLADVLVEADYRGHYSHGLNRVDMYVKDVEAGICKPGASPKILKESAATAWVDGMNGLGPVVGNFCMNLAIRKAQECGVGWVSAKGSNHYGIAGWYSMTAIRQKLLGMSFTNTSPFLCPTRSKEAALGTNPISLGAPAKDGDSLVVDLATTAVAVGKIEVQKRKKEPIPLGWAQDQDGKLTTDADLAFNAKKLMPLGGAELTSGYKGYGLAILVEVFCGILSGSSYGPNIRDWMSTHREANLGQCFVAINPENFAPGFEDRMSDLMGHLRKMEPADPEKPVLVPGDPERNHMAAVDKQGGIRYHENQLKASMELAKRLNIQPMRLNNSKS